MIELKHDAQIITAKDSETVSSVLAGFPELPLSFFSWLEGAEMAAPG